MKKTRFFSGDKRGSFFTIFYGTNEFEKKNEFRFEEFLSNTLPLVECV